MMMTTITMGRRKLVLLAAGLAASGARAQIAAPTRILVGAPAGGSTDTLARTLAQELGRLLGKVVVVENRPGAGGNIAAEAVGRAAPDGNTLLMSFTSHAINASLYPSLPFDPVKDFTALTCVATSPSLLVAHPSLPAKDVRELITLAKANPGKLNFAIGALGSSLHLAGDLFKMQSGTYIVNIAYRGTAPAIQDVIAGQVELMFAAVGNAQAHVRAGKLKALGVTVPGRWRLSPTCRRSPRRCPVMNRAPGSACSGLRECRARWQNASATPPGRPSRRRKCAGGWRRKARFLSEIRRKSFRASYRLKSFAGPGW